MSYFPVHLDLKNRKVVVVGGGPIAARKIRELMASQAVITVVAPMVVEEIRRLNDRGRVKLTQRAFRSGDLRGSWLVVAATDDRKLHQKIRNEAERQKIWLNVVDKTEFCSFLFPARVVRGSFVLTVGTGGASPALARKVREDLEKKFGEEYGALARLMAKLRHRIPPGRERSDKFNRFVRSPILRHLREKNTRAVDQLLMRHFSIHLRRVS